MNYGHLVSTVCLITAAFNGDFGSRKSVFEDVAGDITHNFYAVHSQDFSLVVHVVFRYCFVKDLCPDVQQHLRLIVIFKFRGTLISRNFFLTRRVFFSVCVVDTLLCLSWTVFASCLKILEAARPANCKQNALYFIQRVNSGAVKPFQGQQAHLEERDDLVFVVEIVLVDAVAQLCLHLLVKFRLHLGSNLEVSLR